MSKSKLGIATFDINIKFSSKNDAYKHGKNLREFIRYICKKKKWCAEAMICISNTKGNSSYIRYEHNGKVGRPKKYKEYYSDNDDIEWHLHILLVSKPSYAFRELIKKYIDKNWYNKLLENVFYEKYNKKAYKKNANIKKAEYFINQADEILFCNYNYSDENIIPIGYSLKDLYYAYIKYNTSLKYACSYGNKRLELENKYLNIMNFYWNITKEQDKKIVDKYMKEARLIKIAENYEKIEKNKVQKNLCISRIRMPEESWF